MLIVSLLNSLIVARKQSNTAPSKGRLNNAAEFAVTKLDDIINWARTVGH